SESPSLTWTVSRVRPGVLRAGTPRLTSTRFATGIGVGSDARQAASVPIASQSSRRSRLKVTIRDLPERVGVTLGADVRTAGIPRVPAVRVGPVILECRRGDSNPHGLAPTAP